MEPSRNQSTVASQLLLDTGRRSPMLSAEREVALARAREAFDALLASHVRLVVTLAHEFASFGLPKEDLVGEGLLGLVEATRRFDPDRNVRLAAYAAWWIRAYMRRYTIQNRRIVRAPSTRPARKLMANLRRVQRELTQKQGEPPAVEEVAKALRVGVADVEQMEAALSSRDVTLAGGEDRRPVDLPDAAPSPEDLVAEAEERARTRDALDRAIGGLSTRERRIVCERYFGDTNESLANVGRGLGLSRERVRQLERLAQTKLRGAVLASVA
jgi:RNA polymerase sigma-32 factor